MEPKSSYKAIDLLEKVLEFTEMTPDSTKWDLGNLKTNPPRYIRLQQINSLLGAFLKNREQTSLLTRIKSLYSSNSKHEIQAFLDGDFIKKNTIEEYDGAIHFMNAFLNHSIATEEDKIHVEHLSFIYTRLVKYKGLLRQLKTFNSQWLAAGTLVARFQINLTDSITKNVTDKEQDLDEILELIINPTGLSFTITELVDVYHYPTENLDEVDIEFY